MRHAFPPQFSGRSFLGWSRWQVGPRGGFIGGPEPCSDQQCQGPHALEVGFRSIFVGLAIILAALSPRLGGGRAGGSPERGKSCNLPLGVLSQASLKDS